MSAIGMPASLVLGYGAEAFEQFCTAFSTQGWHFYASRPARGGAGGTDMTPHPALVYAGNLYRQQSTPADHALVAPPSSR